MGNTDSGIRSKEQSVDIEVKNAILKRLEVEGRTKTIEFVVKLCCVDHFLSRIRDHTMSCVFLRLKEFGNRMALFLSLLYSMVKMKCHINRHTVSMWIGYQVQ